MVPFSRDQLNQALGATFDAVTLQSAVDYVWGDRLSDPSVERVGSTAIVTASVQGSLAIPYQVKMVLRSNSKQRMSCEAWCTCPVEHACKHCAAVLMRMIENPEWFDREQLLPGLVRETQRAPKPETLDPALTLWVQRLAEATVERRPVAPAADPKRERVVYLLEPTSHGLEVVPARSKLLKSGAWGAPSQLPWNYFFGPSGLDFPSAEDRLIARELAMSQSNASLYVVSLEGKTGSDSLKSLVMTGRCYWRKAGNSKAPLTLGEGRLGKLGWVLKEGGLQKPVLEIGNSPLQVFLLDPPWYLDETRNECGRLVLDVPAAVARTWVTAPAVPVTQAPVLARRLAAALSVPVPAPAEIQIRVVRDCVPTPCLTLSTVELPEPKWMRNRWSMPEPPLLASLARLEFDYAGRRIRAWTGEPWLEQIQNGEIVRTHRNQALEAKASDHLVGCGLSSASEVFADEWLEDYEDDLACEEGVVWIRFLRDEVPRLQKLGWRIQVAPDFAWRLAEAQEWTTEVHPDGGTDTGNSWFDVELGVVVDGERHSLLPMLLELFRRDPLALSRERLADESPNAALQLRLKDGRLLFFPLARARQVLGVLLELFETPKLRRNKSIRLDRLRALELTDAEEWRWMGPSELKEMAGRLRDFRGVQRVAPPAGLQAQLRPYQQEGVSWLQFLREYDLAGILADDMGLGKTIQTLAHLLVEKESGRADRPSLVVAPTSLMTNWRQEATRFAPDLRVLVLHGLDRKSEFDRIADHDLVLTTYPLLPRDLPTLLEHEFHYVILDEAQFIKNARTKYAQGACQLKARHRLCLTGTPMENHLGELWSLFQFLLPGFLGDELGFNSRFRRPIEKHGDSARREVLIRRVAPFLLRRRKEQVALELPPKTEITQTVELGGAQRDLYESVRLAMHAKVREEVAKKGLSRSHIVVLDALLKLRQICCHPQLLSLPGAKKVRESAKLDLLLELLETMIAEGRRVLLFSQFTSMLALIEEQLKCRQTRYVILTGSTRDRATPVEQFQKGEVPLFLISLKAGGTGLNLTAADTVIHYDPWWNPAVENQATDRAHRIGQSKQVFVYRLIAEGTVEEKIAALQVRKRELVEGLLNAEGTGKVDLTAEDLDFLFDPVS